MTKTPILLMIFDGWGLRPPVAGNAIAQAHPTRYEALLAQHPWIPIDASGNAVGLPDGQMGNSEVGHITLGAGRIVYQELTRIDKAIASGDFFTNPAFRAAVEHARNHQSALHLMGLVGPGGVHSQQTHLLALLDLAKWEKLDRVFVHAFLDGRDVPPRSAAEPLAEIERKLKALHYAPIQTLSGRYYAMDRDNRWERVQQAYDNLTLANGKRTLFSLNALEASYNDGKGDEFVLPTVCDITFQGIQDNDAVIFFNFRPDRARELTRAFTQKAFTGFDRQKRLENLHFTCMTPYDESFGLPAAFEKDPLVNILPEVISQRGLTQFRCAETEKYAHVTYFFNGGREEPYPGEDRTLIPSPRVATYDLQPEMSAPAVCDAVVAAIESGQYDLMVVNFANPDMVGHTGVLPAALKAVQTVDAALGRIVDALAAVKGTLLLTADHGNIEMMIDEDGGPHTAHTTNDTPFVLVSPDPALALDRSGRYGLSNIAPTILELMGLPIPPEMTSPSMLARQAARL